jgi:hypothetical protein
VYLFNKQTGFTAALLLSLTACGGDGYEGYTLETFSPLHQKQPW